MVSVVSLALAVTAVYLFQCNYIARSTEAAERSFLMGNTKGVKRCARDIPKGQSSMNLRIQCVFHRMNDHVLIGVRSWPAAMTVCHGNHSKQNAAVRSCLIWNSPQNTCSFTWHKYSFIMYHVTRRLYSFTMYGKYHNTFKDSCYTWCQRRCSFSLGNRLPMDFRYPWSKKRPSDFWTTAKFKRRMYSRYP